jgi:hypothetical protein
VEWRYSYGSTIFDLVAIWRGMVSFKFWEKKPPEPIVEEIMWAS